LPAYRAESCAINNPEQLKQDWNDLQTRADCSYFQSWGWVSVWLEQISFDLDLVIVKVWCGDLLVGLGLFTSKQIIRHRIIYSHAMFLHEYPFYNRNMDIEYNGLLADKKHRLAVYRETVNYLFKTCQTSDEFFFGGLSANDDFKLLEEIGDGCNSNLCILEESLTWSVDLDVIEQGVSAFLQTLSKNRRTQIRRSFKTYEEQAPLVLKEACNVEEALVFFDGLKELHTAHWQSRGDQDCFANPLWEKFHRALICSRFSKGEMQLLKVSSTTGAIGFLYNFIWRKRVYVLQTGFNMTADKRLMPGYVVHVLAIAYNKQKGMAVYDLMHGYALYKKILCNQTEELCWVVLQRQRLKFIFENMATKAVRSLRGVLSANMRL